MKICRPLGMAALPLALSACQAQLPFTRVQMLDEAPECREVAGNLPNTDAGAVTAKARCSSARRPGSTCDAGASGKPAPVPDTQPADDQPLEPEKFAPLGKAPSYIPPRPLLDAMQLGEKQTTPTPNIQNNDFLPTPDRWRVGIPGDYIQNTRSNTLFDPYSQNVLKGDYALPGTQDRFFILTATSDTLIEARRVPTPSGVSTRDPGSFGFFGRGESQLIQQNFILSGDYFIGDAAYQPKEFEIRATGVINANYVHTHELDLVSPDVVEGHDRTDYAFALQELFVEKKITDLSHNFDFVSVRAGIQGFNNDFRGFLFADDNLGVRLFGNYANNRIQYNLALFHQLEKDTNSGLNTLTERNQNILLANVFCQDFGFPGYTAQLSAVANIDHSGMRYDDNGFLARPSPIGTIGTNQVDAYYLGWAGDGHIGRFNITHQFYQAFGRETANAISGTEQQIDARFAAIELSYDMDYVRLRTSFVYSSGDNHPQDNRATGFDSIFDNPNFAGGGFSYFVRQSIPLTGTGVNLVNRQSFIPDLRTSKEQGQANFVNPGLLLFNVGADVDVTPELTLIGNASYLRFDTTAPLQLLLQDNKISRDIGTDLSIGARYRPLLSNNLILTGGFAVLVPGAGFADLYTSEVLYSGFMSVTVTY